MALYRVSFNGKAARLGALLLLAAQCAFAANTAHLAVKCSPENDLWRVLKRPNISIQRYDSTEDAIQRAPRGSGVLILSDGYPDKLETVSQRLFDLAASKDLRLYVEYPSFVPGILLTPSRANRFERAVVASNAFGAALPRLRILGIHDCRFVRVAVANPDIVLARVAGFDTAVYGLPDHEVFPILFTTSNNRTMVATTKLSNLITGRYQPLDAWSPIWKRIIEWAAGAPLRSELQWTPDVRPWYERGAQLPDDAELQAIIRSARWFQRSRMLIHPQWKHKLDDAAAFPDRVAPAPSQDLPPGDGSAGLLEGFSSAIHPDGSQPVRWWVRADCIGEASFALALAGLADPALTQTRIARNLNDYLYFNSVLQAGSRADPKSPSYGLLGWNTTAKYAGDLDGFDVYYGDDNARAVLGTIGASAALKTSRWDEAVARCILANYRTTGKYGFRGKRIDQPRLQARGWKSYFASDLINYAPHYEAYLWAVYLWAYEHTGYRPFLERTRGAIQMTMHAYPHEWRWTNGLQQERARMLLPLAWLVRVEDTPEHRGWLSKIARDLLSAQDSSGALREEIGSAGKGDYGPPKSNDEYGAAEAPLIQKNGDPVTDLLYTANFALLGLHEAAAATDDATYRTAEDRLADFLCRIQVRSEKHPELEGAWFRAFDFERWDYWASNADSGWGAWSIETGWTQSWITSVLQLRRMKTSYWDLTRSSQIGRPLEKLAPVMLESGDRSEVLK